MIEALILTAMTGTGDVWFTPRPDGDQYWVQGQHTSIACCYEFHVSPEQAEHVVSYDNCGPFDWWDGEGLSWIIYAPCDDEGIASGSYPLGEMEDDYDGPMGLLSFDEATDFEPVQHCTGNNPAAFWFSGSTPALPMDGSHWITCPGDYDGDGVVGNLDVMWVLAYWDRPVFPDGYTVEDYLAVLAYWGLCTE
jgi:hypothetical protein